MQKGLLYQSGSCAKPGARTEHHRENLLCRRPRPEERHGFERHPSLCNQRLLARHKVASSMCLQSASLSKDLAVCRTSTRCRSLPEGAIGLLNLTKSQRHQQNKNSSKVPAVLAISCNSQDPGRSQRRFSRKAQSTNARKNEQAYTVPVVSSIAHRLHNLNTTQSQTEEAEISSWESKVPRVAT